MEQRREHAEKVTCAIIDISARFSTRPPVHRPLKMQQIADQVKVHVTTVSRAVDDKWVQTPRGILPSSGFSAAAKERPDDEDVA